MAPSNQKVLVYIEDLINTGLYKIKQRPWIVGGLLILMGCCFLLPLVGVPLPFIHAFVSTFTFDALGPFAVSEGYGLSILLGSSFILIISVAIGVIIDKVKQHHEEIPMQTSQQPRTDSTQETKESKTEELLVDNEPDELSQYAFQCGYFRLSFVRSSLEEIQCASASETKKTLPDFSTVPNAPSYLPIELRLLKVYYKGAIARSIDEEKIIVRSWEEKVESLLWVQCVTLAGVKRKNDYATITQWLEMKLSPKATLATEQPQLDRIASVRDMLRIWLENQKSEIPRLKKTASQLPPALRDQSTGEARHCLRGLAHSLGWMIKVTPAWVREEGQDPIGDFAFALGYFGLDSEEKVSFKPRGKIRININQIEAKEKCKRYLSFHEDKLSQYEAPKEMEDQVKCVKEESKRVLHYRNALLKGLQHQEDFIPEIEKDIDGFHYIMVEGTIASSQLQRAWASQRTLHSNKVQRDADSYFEKFKEENRRWHAANQTIMQTNTERLQIIRETRAIEAKHFEDQKNIYQAMIDLAHTQQAIDLAHTQQAIDLAHTQQAIDLAHTQQAIDLAYTQQAIDLAYTQQAIDLAYTKQAIDLAHTKQAQAKEEQYTNRVDNLEKIFNQYLSRLSKRFPNSSSQVQTQSNPALPPQLPPLLSEATDREGVELVGAEAERSVPTLGKGNKAGV